MAGDSPRSFRLSSHEDLPRLLEEARLSIGPVLVVVGGAGGLAPDDEDRLRVLIRDYLVPVVVRVGASVVDGGTDSGVMRAIGSARSDADAPFQLVGVVAAGTVPSPGDGDADAGTVVDPNHTHIVLVPGTEWGDESPWLSDVASALSVGHPSVTLLVNGGEIAYADVQRSLLAGRPLIVLAGSGRAADDIASGVWGTPTNELAGQIASSPLVSVVSLEAPRAFSAALATGLADASSAE